MDPDGLRKGIKNTIEGVGEQYVDDFMLIVDKFFNNTFVNGRLNGQLVSKNLIFLYFRWNQKFNVRVNKRSV